MTPFLVQQPGNGHVNGRTPGYVETLMCAQGYGRDVAATRRLRAHASLPWFRSNIQVFVKKGNRHAAT